jgi:hypothetical protein
MTTCTVIEAAADVRAGAATAAAGGAAEAEASPKRNNSKRRIEGEKGRRGKQGGGTRTGTVTDFRTETWFVISHSYIIFFVLIQN